MATYTEKTENKLEVTHPYKIINCLQTTITFKDGNEIGRSRSSYARVPGDDLTNETCADIKAIATALWTTDVINTYKAHLASEPE
tara:strand:- start:584 stop:838 length:255 start_codon:yes stop_codon:yes gene_type:complete